MIKVIIFDLGGVLFTNGTKKFIEDISLRYSLNLEKVKDVMDGEIGTEYREVLSIQIEMRTETEVRRRYPIECSLTL